MKPIHEHDCDVCTYLGSDREIAIDYYIHKSDKPLEMTLIARYGVMGDYMSGTYFYLSNPYINVAGNMALDQGHTTLQQINEQLRIPISQRVVLDLEKFKGI